MSCSPHRLQLILCQLRRDLSSRPEGKPLIVLSNGDGCVVARSKAAKALGVPDLKPYFEVRSLVEKHGIVVFSSNYPLYGDISQRVMNTLSAFAQSVEVYSIDEIFLEPANIGISLKEYGHSAQTCCA